MEYQNDPNPGGGKAIASLVLGILSVVGFGLVVGIVGIVLGVQAKKAQLEVGGQTGLATAGIILSIIGTVFGSLFFIFFCAPLLGLGCLGVLAA